MNNDLIKSMSQELNGMICYGGLFEKVARDTSPNTAGHVAGALGGAALGAPVGGLVSDFVTKKTPNSKLLPFLAGTAALLPFASVGGAVGAKIQKEGRRSKREEMVMRELLKNPAFRDRVATASRSRDTI